MHRVKIICLSLKNKITPQNIVKNLFVYLLISLMYNDLFCINWPKMIDNKKHRFEEKSLTFADYKTAKTKSVKKPI